MGKRGFPPAPTSLKLLNGTRASRVNVDEPVPIDEPPVCPPNVAPDVRAIWDYTVAHLITMKLAKSADRDALRCYCEAVVNHRKASELLAKSPILIKGLHGGMIRNPALAVQRDNAHVIRQFAQEFGLTPSARSGIAIGGRRDDAEPNPFAVDSTG